MPEPRRWILLLFAVGATLALLALFRVVAWLLAGARSPAPNSARCIVLAGELLGVFLISGAVAAGCVHGASLRADLIWTAVYGSCAALLLAVAGRLGVMMLLGSRLPAEIERGNKAAAIAAAGHVVATAVIISRCLYGDDVATLGVSVVFFLLGQASLHVFVILFRALTSYDDAEEIRGENVAAALSYAGVTIALSLIIGHAAEGTFSGWISSMRGFGVALLYAVGLYPVRQLVVQTLCLGHAPTLWGGKLCEGISRERNIGYGVVEAAAYLATALLIIRFA
jgi:uncharacterized membrane protein YjfL (UPF0719 family)